MPTYEASPEFFDSHKELTAAQRREFRAAVDKFIVDLRAGKGFRKGLRVKRIKGWPGIYEMTWAPNGRAAFQFGTPVTPGEAHIIWHVVGDHSIFP